MRLILFYMVSLFAFAGDVVLVDVPLTKLPSISISSDDSVELGTISSRLMPSEEGGDSVIMQLKLKERSWGDCAELTYRINIERMTIYSSVRSSIITGKIEINTPSELSALVKDNDDYFDGLRAFLFKNSRLDAGTYFRDNVTFDQNALVSSVRVRSGVPFQDVNQFGFPNIINIEAAVYSKNLFKGVDFYIPGEFKVFPPGGTISGRSIRLKSVDLDCRLHWSRSSGYKDRVCVDPLGLDTMSGVYHRGDVSFVFRYTYDVDKNELIIEKTIGTIAAGSKIPQEIYQLLVSYDQLLLISTLLGFEKHC